MLAAVSTCTTINWMLPSSLASHMGDAKDGFTFFYLFSSFPGLSPPWLGCYLCSSPLQPQVKGQCRQGASPFQETQINYKINFQNEAFDFVLIQCHGEFGRDVGNNRCPHGVTCSCVSLSQALRCHLVHKHQEYYRDVCGERPRGDASVR